MMNQSAASMHVNTINAKGQSYKKFSDNRGMVEVMESRGQSKMSSQFSKTEMCKFNLLGVCNKGSACGFAHTANELKSRPDLSRTKFCRAFLQTGRCDNGKNCAFAHSKDELRSTNFFRKTKLCRFWQLGQCGLGDKCRFAHSSDELREEAEETEKPQHKVKHNNSMAIPAILNQIQLLSHQRQQLQQQQMKAMQWQQHHEQRSQEETVPEYIDLDDPTEPPMEIALSRGNSCATPEYSDLDDPTEPPLQAAYPMSLQHIIVNGKTVPVTAFALPGLQQNNCSPGYPARQQSKDTGSTSATDPQDSNSFSTFSDSPSPTTPQEEPWGSDWYGASAPDFLPNHGRGQRPGRMAPPMQRLPVTLAPVQQMSTIEKDTGDAIDYYTGDVKIMQAPLDYDYCMDASWQADNEYQVKNTFISVDERKYYPLRCVRSAAGRLAEAENLS